MTEYLSQSGPIVNATPENVIPEPNPNGFAYSAPVLMRKLEYGSFINKSITGTFKTDSEGDSVLFISAYREGPDDYAESASFYNGYGIALRVGGEGEDDPHNLFIIYNSLGVKDVVIEKVIHTGWGDYGYLSSTALPIKVNTVYNFEITYADGGALNAYIWEGTSKPLLPSISYGAFDHRARGQYYGISCSNTQGDTWYIDNFTLSDTASNYVMKLSRIDITDLDSSFSVSAQAFAIGYVPGSFNNAGIYLYCYNYNTGAWVQQDYHDSAVGGGDIRLNSGELLLSEYGSPNIPRTVDALLVSEYPSNYLNGVDSYIYIDYIKAESWNSEYSHVGGKGDIYIKDTASFTAAYLDILNCDIKELLVHTNSKIITDFYSPMLWIDQVELLDFSGNPTGSYLVQNSDWTYECITPSTRFSPREEILLILASPGWNLRVHYQTFANISAIQDYCDSIAHRNVTDDLLVKSKRPIELFMDLSIVGTESPFNIRSYVSNWIKTYAEDTLTYSDIAIYLQSYTAINDATVNSVSYRTHLDDGSYVDTTLGSTATLTITETEMFVIVPDVTHIAITVS